MSKELEKELESYRNITVAMALDIAAVGEALGIPAEEQEGGTGEFIEAIEELKAERDALAAQLAELGRKLDEEEYAHGETISRRDNAEHWADELAGAIAEKLGVDIGEHSNLNCPWEEALNWIQADQAQLAVLKGQELIYLYRRLGNDDFATCDHARYVELSNHKLFETMVAFPEPKPVAPAQQVVPELYECIGKGGEYEKLGYAKPSGAERAIRGESGLIVYRDARNGQLYYRDPHDFQRRMQKISAAPQSVAQESE